MHPEAKSSTKVTENMFKGLYTHTYTFLKCEKIIYRFNESTMFQKKEIGN